MASSRDQMELTLGEWLEALAEWDVGPGGGSALAAAAAAASAVLVMASRVSGSGGLAAQAEALLARTTPLAQLNAERYIAALAARNEVAGHSAEQRDYQLGLAFARAAEPPLDIARAAVDVVELAAELARSGDPRVRADALAAAALAAGVARGAVALVEVNLTALPDDPRVAEARQCASNAEHALARAAR
jgi:methenyltetrahydrofolate cyclohydrolase